jgi:hypothetical protein
MLNLAVHTFRPPNMAASSEYIFEQLDATLAISVF